MQDEMKEQPSQQRVDAQYKLAVLCLSAALVAYMAFFNPLGVAPDYSAYVGFFEVLRIEGFSNSHKWEPGFLFLAWGLSFVSGSSHLVFSLIVFFSSLFKIFILFRVALSFTAYALCLILFFFKFFPLQDYNQVRISLALGLLILAYYLFTINNNNKIVIFFGLLAVLFHYSILALIPLLYALKFDLVTRKKYILGATAAVFLGLAASGYVVIHILMNVIPRLGSYAGSFYPAVSSPLSPVFYPEFFLLVASIYFWDDLTNNMKRIVGLQLVGFAIFYGLYEFGVIGTRLREAIFIFWLFYVADFSRVTLQLKVAIGLFVLMNVALGSYLFYFSNFLR